MLAEQRHTRIVEMVGERGTVTVPELASALDTSESTIRRDLDRLDRAGRLAKVHGGATARATNISAGVTRDLGMSEKRSLNVAAKRRIAAHAATLVRPDDFVFIDAGSTTASLIDHLTEHRATYVTDAVTHALRLAEEGFEVVVLGGELKGITEALVGPDAIDALARYHFTLGFWGANGIDAQAGITTPERSEAMVKRISLERCDPARRYVLADDSKFGLVASVTFAEFSAATVLTNSVPEAYQTYDNIVEVSA